MLFPSQIVTKWLVIDFLLAVEISRHLTGLSVGDDMVHLHLDQEEPESFLSGSDQFGSLVRPVNKFWDVMTTFPS